jgi:hypothetical protein
MVRKHVKWIRRPIALLVVLQAGAARADQMADAIADQRGEFFYEF